MRPYWVGIALATYDGLLVAQLTDVSGTVEPVEERFDIMSFGLADPVCRVSGPQRMRVAIEGRIVDQAPWDTWRPPAHPTDRPPLAGGRPILEAP